MRHPALRRAVCLAFVATCIAAIGCKNPFAGLGELRNGGVVPADWAGIWNVTVRTSLCDPDSVTLEESHSDTICAGAAVGDEFDIPGLLGGGSLDLGVLCSTTQPRLAGDVVSYSCAGVVMVGPCENTVAADVALTLDRVAHTYAGTGRVSVGVEPNDAVCGPDRCFDFTINATRVSATSPGCPAKPGL